MGATQDAEDLVQETFLLAWSKRASFQGRSTFRAWLYGIATNACLDALRRRPRRVTPPEVTGPADPLARPGPATDLPWLETYPDLLLENVVAAGVDPEAMLVRREALARLSELEKSLLADMVDAWDRTDIDAVAALLGADARLVMPPTTSWYDGRESITTFLASHAFTPGMAGGMRALATAANRQPALGVYVRDEQAHFRPFALLVLT